MICYREFERQLERELELFWTEEEEESEGGKHFWHDRRNTV